jgi:hypothetical protein
VDFGVGGAHRIALPGGWSEGFLHGDLTVLAPPVIPEDGRDAPKSDGVRDLLAAAKRDGARQVYFGPMMDDWRDYNANGLILLARTMHLHRPLLRDLRFHDPMVIRREALSPGDPTPCLLLHDGAAVYLARPGPNPFFSDFQRLRTYCPSGYGNR